LTDGIVEWEFITDGTITASPAVDDEGIYVGCWDQSVYALDAKTGGQLWRHPVGWGIVSTPAIDDKYLYVGCMDNSLYALDKQNGQKEWSFSAVSSIQSSPIVYGDFILVGSDDGHFYALNTTTGIPGWSFRPNYETRRTVYNYVTTPISSNPAVANEAVFIAAGGTVYALDAQTTAKPRSIDDTKSAPITTLMGVSLIFMAALAIILFMYYRNQIQFLS
jgi:glucose dehydrogenase